MKFTLLFALASLLLMGSVSAQHMNKKESRPSPSATAKGQVVSIKYSQPAKKGREIFGTLVPYGQVWRTGANEATEITFSKDVTFGDKPVKAGTYTLFTIPNQGQWMVILNSELGQWGAFKYDKSKDVATTQVPATQLTAVTEVFTIRVTAAGSNQENVMLDWDKTEVSVPVKF